MSTRRNMRRYLWSFALVLLLGCGSSSPPAANVQATQTRVVELAERATLTAPTATGAAGVTSVATTTATGTLPTPAAQSTAQPTGIPTSAVSTAPRASQQLTAEVIVQRLKSAGLPIGDVVVWNAETDPNKLLGRPGQYISKATFHDTRLEKGNEPSVDVGGDVETFATEAEMKTRKDYIEAVTRSSPLLVQYVYSSGLALLRVSKALTPDQAAVYQQALPAAAR